MTAHLTEREAVRLGLTAAKPKRTRRTARNTDCLPNRCVTCGETFTGETAERRHSDTSGHHRFEVVL